MEACLFTHFPLHTRVGIVAIPKDGNIISISELQSLQDTFLVTSSDVESFSIIERDGGFEAKGVASGCNDLVVLSSSSNSIREIGGSGIEEAGGGKEQSGREQSGPIFLLFFATLWFSSGISCNT